MKLASSTILTYGSLHRYYYSTQNPKNWYEISVVPIYLVKLEPVMKSLAREYGTVFLNVPV